MNRKALAVAVATAFAAPVAFAQTSVTIGGTVNIMWDYVKATGATQGTGGSDANLKAHDRVRDGAGSNIRFFVNEDLGGGNSAFVQVESAVIANSDTRSNAVGGGTVATSGWGNRNTGIGIRSKAAGRFLIGVWDVHYDEMNKVDPGWIIMGSHGSTLGLMNNFGIAASAGTSSATIGIGTRYSNVLRWDSPVWGGFSLTANYARPTDGAPVNSAGDPRDGKKNRVYNIAPRFEWGGLVVQYSYLQDKDIGIAGTFTYVGATVISGTGNLKVTSNRIGARYRFGMGVGIGVIYDQSKADMSAVAGTGSIKREVWSLPITFDTGNHSINFSYSWADDWEGSFANAGSGTGSVSINGESGINLNGETGAKMWTLGYAYKLSKRTNVHVSYAEIRNDKAVRYDTFANSTGNTGFGADPKQFAMGIRHTW
jgi:predicted porin